MQESKVVVHVHQVRVGFIGYLTVAALCTTAVALARIYFENK